MGRTVWLDDALSATWSGRDPFVMVDALEGTVYRALEGRKTFRTVIDGRACFVKIHRGVGWLEIVKNLLSLRLPIVSARNEKVAIETLTQAGVATMTLRGYGVVGVNPARRHSFLITDEIAPSVSLEDFCRDWPENRPSWHMKQFLLTNVARMVRDMHRAGVNHRDLYICHFLLRNHEAGLSAASLHLIDLHRAQKRDTTPIRWRNKDLAALHFSALYIGLSRTDYLRFLAIYFSKPWRQVLVDERPLLSWLKSESVRLDRRFQRKFA